MAPANTRGQTIADDINLISVFLSHSQLSSIDPLIISDPYNTLEGTVNPSTVVVAASAILHQAHAVFSFFKSYLSITNSKPSSITTLILTGGIGHSTTHLYDAIVKHPIFASLPARVGLPNGDLTGLSEAKLFHLIFVHFYDGERVARDWNSGLGLQVLVEGESTNCGANAVLSRALLEQSGVRLGSRPDANGDVVVDDVVVVQDPTMCLRTKASFEKVYEDDVRMGVVRFWTWPTFVPKVKVDNGGTAVWDPNGMKGVDIIGLWDMRRFYGLILGEIPRLRDDAGGYGPKGKGFIAHVEVTDEIVGCWKRLSASLDFQR